jgi:hypothetical protein
MVVCFGRNHRAEHRLREVSGRGARAQSKCILTTDFTDATDEARRQALSFLCQSVIKSCSSFLRGKLAVFLAGFGGWYDLQLAPASSIVPVELRP